MPAGKALSDDLRKVVVHMHSSTGLSADRIAELTGISRRTVFRILKTWRLEGNEQNLPQRQRGRPRLLDFTDSKVSFFLWLVDLLISQI